MLAHLLVEAGREVGEEVADEHLGRRALVFDGSRVVDVNCKQARCELAAQQDSTRLERTVMPDASSSADDLALVLLEVDDCPAAQAEDCEARDVLRGGRVGAGERRDVFLVDFGFKLGPRELGERNDVSGRSERRLRAPNAPRRPC